MPSAIIGGAVAAVGSIASSAISSKSAKNAAKAQQQSTAAQIEATNANRDYQYGLNAPTIQAGQAGLDTLQSLLGVGGTAGTGQTGLDQFRASTGYQDLLDSGLSAINSNAYARGMGDSGATLKALQRTGAGIANQSAQGYIGNLGTLINAGSAARGFVGGIGSNATVANNGALQAGADAQGNAALATGSSYANGVQNLANIGASLASSFGQPAYNSDAAIYGRSPTLQNGPQLSPFALSVR